MWSVNFSVIGKRVVGLGNDSCHECSTALLFNGEVDVAIGGDQAGSIRIPAAWCGCVGLMLVGERFDDGTVLRAAAEFERAVSWENH